MRTTVQLIIADPSHRESWEQANHALDQADSDYVMFLAPGRAPLPGALDRLHDLGVRQDADVVVGRAGGSGPLAQRALESRSPTLLMDDRSLDRLTRTEFIRDRGIRFRALGDLSNTAFLVELFLAGPRIVGDLNQIMTSWNGQANGAYRWLPASSTEYGSGLRQILDLIETHTEPGPRRDSFTAAVWQHEVVGRLGRRDLVALPSAQAWSLLQEARNACADRVPVRLDERLEPGPRAIARLVRSGLPEEISDLAARIEQVQPRALVTMMASSAVSAVDIGVEVGMQEKKRPLRLRAGSAGWLPPSVLAAESPSATAIDEPAEFLAEVVLRHRLHGTEVVLPAGLKASVEQVGGEGEIIWSGVARFEPHPTGGRFELAEGHYDVLVRIRTWGLDREGKLTAAGLDDPGQITILIGPDGRVDRFHTTRRGNLSLEIAARPSSVLRKLAPSRIVLQRQRILLETGVLWSWSSSGVTLSLTPAAGGARTSFRLTAGPLPSQWAATPRRSWISLRPGSYAASLTVVLPGSGGLQTERRKVRLHSPVTISPSTAAWWLGRLVVAGARHRSAALLRRMRSRQ